MTSQPAMPPTSLLCRLGWHAPGDDIVWNGGYGFATCRRCGRDMVRSLFGEWHVPKGYRVVWGKDPEPPPEPAKLTYARPTEDVPAEQVTAEPAMEDAPEPAGPPADDPRSASTQATPPVRSPFEFDDLDSGTHRAKPRGYPRGSSKRPTAAA